MITPSRWFAGGRGLDEYRDEMLNDTHMMAIIDYADTKECFPTVAISGGVNYFLWSDSHNGLCHIVNVIKGECNDMERKLSEYPVFVRYNLAISIIRKINMHSKKCLSSLVLSSNPFGFRTYIRGEIEPFSGSIRFIHSDGVGYISRSEVHKNKEAIDACNVIMTRAMSGGNKPSVNGSYQIIPSTMRVMRAGEICNETYICIGQFEKEYNAECLKSYLSTKLVRFLMLQAMTSIMINKDVFRFVPLQDFTKHWTDYDLYNMYAITENERSYIERLIKSL